MSQKLIKQISDLMVEIVSETNGIGIAHTIELAINSEYCRENPTVRKSLTEFRKLLGGFQQDEVEIQTLLQHPVSEALQKFFKKFPLPFKEEHIHLTGSLTADFVWPRLKPLLKGPHKDKYWKKIRDTYGDDIQLDSEEDVAELLSLKRMSALTDI